MSLAILLPISISAACELLFKSSSGSRFTTMGIGFTSCEFTRFGMFLYVSIASSYVLGLCFRGKTPLKSQITVSNASTPSLALPGPMDGPPPKIKFTYLSVPYIFRIVRRIRVQRIFKSGNQENIFIWYLIFRYHVTHRYIHKWKACDLIILWA